MCLYIKIYTKNQVVYHASVPTAIYSHNRSVTIIMSVFIKCSLISSYIFIQKFIMYLMFNLQRFRCIHQLCKCR